MMGSYSMIYYAMFTSIVSGFAVAYNEYGLAVLSAQSMIGALLCAILEKMK